MGKVGRGREMGQLRRRVSAVLQQTLSEPNLRCASAVEGAGGWRNSAGGSSRARAGIGTSEGNRERRGGGSHQVETDTQRRDSRTNQSGAPSDPRTLPGIDDVDGRHPPVLPDPNDERSRQTAQITATPDPNVLPASVERGSHRRGGGSV